MGATVTDIHGPPPGSPLVPRTHLVLALECARPLAGSARIRIDGAEVRIGRGDRRHVGLASKTNDDAIAVTVPDARMSSLHARLVADGGAWRVEDCGSKNGTFVNERAVTRAPLADGDVVRLGHTLFRFRRDWPTGAEAPEVLDVGTESSAFATLVPALARRYDELGRVAASSIPVLLQGETGTGKEVTAKAVHALSRRRGDFVTVNCGALPIALIESELFGHRRGAFSGAVADHPGLFRSAEGGTILLDEIGDLPLLAQAALLRALQEREVRPVGSTRPIAIDVRVIAATHRNLEALVRAGAFREDLLARLAGFSLELPPLRDRKEDLGILTGVILRGMGPAERPVTFTPAAAGALFAHGWPRNVRELEKALIRAAALARGGVIDAPDLGLSEASPPKATQDDAHRRRLVDLLTQHRGNLVAVAKALGTSRSQVHRLLERFHLDPKRFRV